MPSTAHGLSQHELVDMAPPRWSSLRYVAGCAYDKLDETLTRIY